MSDEIYEALKDAEREEFRVVFTGDYSSGPVIDASHVTVTVVPGYRWWQRVWAFIRRRELLTAVEIPNATVSGLRYHDDGTASVEIKAQDS